MSLDALNTLDIIEVMENFIYQIRPAEEIRDRLDISYKIENQSIIIFEIRPRYLKPGEKIESPIAKTTFIKSKNHWKVFWMRANSQWYPYDPNPVVKTLDEFLQLVVDDDHYCFWG